MTKTLISAHHFNVENCSIITAQNYIHRESSSSSYKVMLKELQSRIAIGSMHESEERCDAPKCHPETRVAVQDEIYSWIVHDDSVDARPTKIKWLTGPAGSGKTAVAGSLVERCNEEGLLAGCFFFSSSSASLLRRTKTALIPTLAYQIAQHHGVLKCAVANAINQNPIVFEKTLQVQMETLVLQPLRQVISQLGPQSSWLAAKVIVIDGLDECDAEQYHDPTAHAAAAHQRSKEDDQLKILQALLQATLDPAFPFRILVASRPERIFRRFFNPDDDDDDWPHARGDYTDTAVGPPFASVLVLDEKYNADADIALFLKAKFNEIRRRYKLGPAWPGPDTVPRLVKNASGQFVYASTVIRFITETKRGSPHVLLDAVMKMMPTPTPTACRNCGGGNEGGSGGGGEDVMKLKPFAHLDALYTQIIQSSPDPALTTRWLWVIHGDLDPLRTAPPSLYMNIYVHGRPPAAFVNRWLRTFVGEPEHLLGDLHSLVKVPPTNDVKLSYDFYHKTLFDFLGDEDRSGELYVSLGGRLEFFWTKYFDVCLRKGVEVPGDLRHRAEAHTHFLYYFDFMPALLCDEVHFLNVIERLTPASIEWWIRQCISRRLGLHIAGIFDHVHRTCPWYGPCQVPCRLWTEPILRLCSEAKWRIPGRPFGFLPVKRTMYHAFCPPGAY